ncbi:MAG: sulfite exporter TauE/SafE family protein [Dehalococcoidales bacterium]|nr:sulfite exporter TauE/SafE family protein [Dehalococcoidales bacterium]
MPIIYIVILLATGIITGFASGLLGVGGAFIMTPVQFYVYQQMGFSADTAIKIAFGTTLLVILPTAISGTWRHHRHGDIRWKSALIMGSCSILGGLAGATIAVHLSGEVLKMAFGAVVLLSGIRMVIGNRSKQDDVTPRENPWLLVAWAIPVSIITGMLGIGGGIVVIPVMTLALRFSMRSAVATSLAIMIFTSIGGIIGYVTDGLRVFGTQAFSTGYVNVQAFLLLASTSIVTAQFGAMALRRIPERPLRIIFTILMFYVGLRMLGLFELIGWHI